MDYNFIMNYVSEPACLKEQAFLLWHQRGKGGQITLFNFAHQWYHQHNENNVLCMNLASDGSTLVKENKKQIQIPQAVSEYE